MTNPELFPYCVGRGSGAREQAASQRGAGTPPPLGTACRLSQTSCAVNKSQAIPGQFTSIAHPAAHLPAAVRASSESESVLFAAASPDPARCLTHMLCTPVWSEGGHHQACCLGGKSHQKQHSWVSQAGTSMGSFGMYPASHRHLPFTAFQSLQSLYFFWGTFSLASMTQISLVSTLVFLSFHRSSLQDFIHGQNFSCPP